MYGSEVRLIAHNGDDNILTGMFPDALNPFFDIFEGILLGDVIDNQSSLCLPIMPISLDLYAEVMALYCYCPAVSHI